MPPCIWMGLGESQHGSLRHTNYSCQPIISAKRTRFIGQILIIVRKNRTPPLRLDSLPPRRTAYIDRVDWDILSSSEAQRLREFGVDEGSTIETLHRGGLLGRGALACRIGRMTVAMRREHATAIHVRTGPDKAPSQEAAALL